MNAVAKESIALILCTVLAGCAGWHRLEVPVDTTLAQRQQTQIWQGNHSRVLHAVHLTRDSLFGIPFTQPPSCDSCVIRIARARIDSVRVGNQEGPAIAGIMLPLAGGLLLLYLVSRGVRD